MGSLAFPANGMGITAAGFLTLIVMAVFFFVGWHKGLVRELISMLYVVLVFAIVLAVNPYVNGFFQNHTGLYQAVEARTAKTVELAAGQAAGSGAKLGEQVLEKMPLPSFIKKQILEGNTPQAYQELHVSDFAGYLSAFLAKRICSGMSFAVTWLLACILVKTAAALLGIAAKLPVIREANKFGGGCVGLLKALLLVWLVMLILTLFVNAKAGEKALEVIRADGFLRMLYDKDIFIRVFMR